jgi:hypothetical protein
MKRFQMRAGACWHLVPRPLCSEMQLSIQAIGHSQTMYDAILSQVLARN